MAKDTKTAVLAGGCFWCIEHDLKDLKGIVDIQSGYAGGDLENPTYEDVSRGDSGHVESIEVTYDPEVLSYENLLHAYWIKVDPFDKGGQFCDRGPQYRTVVFVNGDLERKTAENVRKELSDRLGQPVVTDILDFTNFYPAEEYHQDYAGKNPSRYRFYRWSCGRDQRVQEVWGKH